MNQTIQNIPTATSVRSQVWTGIQKFAFRTFLVFFIVMLVPMNTRFYEKWITTDWKNLHIRDMGALSGSSFALIKVATKREGGNDMGGFKEERKYLHTIYPESGEFGIESYINWGIAFLIGLFGAAIWTAIDRKERNYDKAYYLLGAFVSFAMLIRLNGLTFSKVFPTQMPDLAETQLNTPFGDFVAQKLYWIQFSFVHNYERFAGYAELVIMLLLFFRQTRAIGAALCVAMIGNIAFANHAYDGGIHLAASFFVLGGAFVLWRYIPPLWRLFIKEEDTALNFTYYEFTSVPGKIFKYGVKLFVFGFYFVLSGYLHWHNYHYDSYKVPQNPGLSEAKGLYTVEEFKLNGLDVPYSPVDSNRWRDVTFEKHSTISFSTFNTFEIHGEAGRGKQIKDVDRTYESAGTGGGRRHFHYEINEANKTLTLQNKNKLYKDQILTLNYDRPSADQIILSGLNENQDSIYMVLNRRPKEYVIFQDRNQEVVWTP